MARIAQNIQSNLEFGLTSFAHLSHMCSDDLVSESKWNICGTSVLRIGYDFQIYIFFSSQERNKRSLFTFTTTYIF